MNVRLANPLDMWHIVTKRALELFPETFRDPNTGYPVWWAQEEFPKRLSRISGNIGDDYWDRLDLWIYFMQIGAKEEYDIADEDLEKVNALLRMPDRGERIFDAEFMQKIVNLLDYVSKKK